LSPFCGNKNLAFERTSYKSALTNKKIIYKEIQMVSGAKSYTRKGFLIYEEMHKYFTILEEAVSNI
jgi:hypothetical protein